MRTLSCSTAVFILCLGLGHSVYADDLSTNAAATTAPPPTGTQDIYTNTTATITPPPPAGAEGDINSNTTQTVTPPPAAATDINSNTTTTTTPPPPLTYYQADSTPATPPPAMPSDSSDRDTDHYANGKLFQDVEFSIDAFGTLALGRQTLAHISEQRIYNNSQLGVGAGGTLFFCRYVGIGGEAYSANTTGSFVDSTSGSIFLRYPIEKAHLAPYIFGGGGYDFEGIRQGFGQAGFGLEVRIIRYMGVFADARYVFASESHDYGVGRAGIRITF